MHHVNPAGLYTLGWYVHALTKIKEGAKLQEIQTLLAQAETLLEAVATGNFAPISDAEPILEKSAPIAQALIDHIGKLIEALFMRKQEGVNYEDVEGVRALAKILDVALAYDFDHAPLFLLEKKGIYDTLDLVENAEKRYPESIRKVLPSLTISDLNQAGKCLAVDLPTACAFHVCRATEGLMRAYYKKLTGYDWPPPPPKPPMRKDWAVLVDQLRIEGAPAAIYNRLGEIRDDRNAYAHPDVIVPIDEAPVIYDLCTGVIFYMAKEMI